MTNCPHCKQRSHNDGCLAAIIAVLMIAAIVALYVTRPPECKVPFAELPRHCLD
jgi:hypothetical protein